jgi:hypothetical protein
VNPKCLISSVSDSLDLFRKVHAPVMPTVPREGPSQTIWIPPPVNSFKVNWDASIDRRGNIMGVGIVVRNHAGRVLAAQCLVQKFIVDPSTAEAIGARVGAELGKKLGLHSILLEGDASVVVEALRREEEDLSRFGNVILETKEMLKDFHFWKVNLVKREGNNAAHLLARFATNQELNQVWVDSFPSCISRTICNELHLSNI